MTALAHRQALGHLVAVARGLGSTSRQLRRPAGAHLTTGVPGT